jgi:mRNA interferase MazF
MENTNNIRKVKRGEIYLYDFGSNPESIQNGLRPVLVVQCDEGNQASPTTIVAALTTAIKKRYMPSHIVLGDNFGLKEPSMVMLEQIRTVNQSELTKYIGFVDSEYLQKKINIGLKKALFSTLWKIFITTMSPFALRQTLRFLPQQMHKNISRNTARQKQPKRCSAS